MGRASAEHSVTKFAPPLPGEHLLKLLKPKLSTFLSDQFPTSFQRKLIGIRLKFCLNPAAETKNGFQHVILREQIATA